MKINSKNISNVKTAEGATAKVITPKQQLERLVMTCMLWEDGFYIDGKTVADLIKEYVGKVNQEDVAEIAIKARSEQYLRHVPLLIVKEMARLGYSNVEDTLYEVIQRADELTEFLAIYWMEGKCPISKKVKKGLARAFTKFNEYQLAKYNRDSVIKLRDVMFMVHPKPLDDEQAEVWKRLVDDNLKTPDTWEVSLSDSSSELSKKDKWTRMLSENKLGGLALLRNLRNMVESEVDRDLIKTSILTMNTNRILPFRFVASAKHAPTFEPELEETMFKSLQDKPKLSGKTLVVVDVSGSMSFGNVSSKSDMTSLDAGFALAMILRELTEDCQVFSFSNQLVEVPPRRGFALADALDKSQGHGGTNLGGTVELINDQLEYDRLIILTDEQSENRVPDPIKGINYMINVSSNKNGVGYGKWTHIDGWSEKIVDYILELEK